MNTAINSEGRKRPANLTLSEVLVVQVRGLTNNLSGVVESLLADYVEHERKQRLAESTTVDATISMWNDIKFNRTPCRPINQSKGAAQDVAQPPRIKRW
jgi:antitoxin CcdA